jgi:hypothetical protein
MPSQEMISDKDIFERKRGRVQIQFNESTLKAFKEEFEK